MHTLSYTALPSAAAVAAPLAGSDGAVAGAAAGAGAWAGAGGEGAAPAAGAPAGAAAGAASAAPPSARITSPTGLIRCAIASSVIAGWSASNLLSPAASVASITRTVTGTANAKNT